MEEHRKLLGYYNYTVILTYIGMITGFVGIAYAIRSNLFAAVVCLMVAGFCDMFDGAIASTKERTAQEKCFGIQIDSFSDLVCFGALPAVLVYSQNTHSQLVLVICSLYLLCALIRLAYYNVDEQERQQNSDTPREIYYGLPVTLAALFLPVIHGAVSLFSWRPALAPTAALLTMAILFLLPIPLHKPGRFGKLFAVLCGVLEVWFVLFACGGVS